MPGLSLPLRLLQNEGFINHPSSPDTALRLPAFVYGDKPPVRLSVYRRSASTPGLIETQDFSQFHVELTLGSRNERPGKGMWTFDFGAVQSDPISVLATADEVSAALNAITSVANAGGVNVAGQPGDWTVTFRTVGARTAATLGYQGETTVAATLSVMYAGGARVPAQWRLELLEQAPARIAPDSWAQADTTPAGHVESLGGGRWRIVLDERSESGFWFLTVGGTATAFINVGASAADVEAFVQLTPAGSNARVVMHPAGGYLLALASSGTTLSLDDSATVIPPALEATLDLSGAGVRELLDGADFAPSTLSVRVLDAATGQIMTEAAADVIVRMPISRTPALDGVAMDQLASLSLPDFTTGLWHSVTLSGTNAAPVLSIGSGVSWTNQRGPVFLGDDDGRGVFMLTIYNGNTLLVSAVRNVTQGAALNAAFNPRAVALASPEDSDLFCELLIEAAADPALEPATITIGDPE